MWVCCLFVKSCLKAKRPLNPAYPSELKTLGDHLRKVRLDRGLSQSEVAKILQVTTDSVTGWELNRHEPPARLAKRIIEFIGYVPFDAYEQSIGRQLYLARLISGMTQRQVAKKIGCDPSSVRYIELDRRRLQYRLRQSVTEFVESVLVKSTYRP